MTEWDPFGARPTVFGDRYRTSEVLGSGGSAVVYRARDLRSDADVALKLVEGDASAAPLRFLAEARDMARLRHPRVVRVLAAGRDGTWYWVAMELMPGGSLRDRVEKSGPMAPVAAATAIYQALQGLHAVHAASLVHRDIKPHNVLIDNEGNARLTDFGLARHELGDVPWRTRTGESLGSPTYRAPEQSRNSADAPREADIYGMGGVLYYVLAGKRPTFFHMMDDAEFAAETAAIPPSFASVVRKAMSFAPEERYRTAFEMALAVGHALDALPDRTHEPVARDWSVAFEQIPERPTTGLWTRVRGWFGLA